MVVAALYDWLLLAHIVAAMVWVGGVVALLACSTAVLRTRDVALIGRFVGILRRVGPIVLAPAPALVLVFGVWMVGESDAWELGQLWVSLAFGLLLAAFAYGAVFQSRAAIAAERASTRGDGDEATRQLRRWARGSAGLAVLLLVVAWDMVFKPGV